MSNQGKALDIIVGLVVAVVLVAILFPVFSQRHGTSARYTTCQDNLKELGIAFQMYLKDNDGMLPSSAVCGSTDRIFRTSLGELPPAKGEAKTVWQLLYPYNRNSNLYFCPSDPTYDRRATPWIPTSYAMKKAINDAWLDAKINARRDEDFKWPAGQLLFYERGNFHWGNDSGDVSDPSNEKRFGVSVNCVFMDTHVKRCRINEFEPDYYNWNMKTDKPVKRGEIDPRVYADRLE